MENTNNTYNGWTNYATWRINLEIFNDGDYSDIIRRAQDAYELRNMLWEYTVELLDMNSDRNSLAYSYACAFLMDVNFHEIAEYIWNEYLEEQA